MVEQVKRELLEDQKSSDDMEVETIISSGKVIATRSFGVFDEERPKKRAKMEEKGMEKIWVMDAHDSDGAEVWSDNDSVIDTTDFMKLPSLRSLHPATTSSPHIAPSTRAKGPKPAQLKICRPSTPVWADDGGSGIQGLELSAEDESFAEETSVGTGGPSSSAASPTRKDEPKKEKRGPGRPKRRHGTSEGPPLGFTRGADGLWYVDGAVVLTKRVAELSKGVTEPPKSEVERLVKAKRLFRDEDGGIRRSKRVSLRRASGEEDAVRGEVMGEEEVGDFGVGDVSVQSIGVDKSNVRKPNSDVAIDLLAGAKRKVGRPKGSTKKSRSPSSTDGDEMQPPGGNAERLKSGRKRGSGNRLSISTTESTAGSTVVTPPQQMETTGFRWLEGFREGDVVWTCWSSGSGNPRAKLWPCLVVRRVECGVGEDGMEALWKAAEGLGIDLRNVGNTEQKTKGGAANILVESAAHQSGGKSLGREIADPVEEVLNVVEETEIVKAVGMGQRRRSSLQWKNKGQHDEDDGVGTTPVISSPRKAAGDDSKLDDSEGIALWDVLPEYEQTGKSDVSTTFFQDAAVPETDDESDGMDEDIDVMEIGSAIGTSGIEWEPISPDTSSPVALPVNTSTRKIQALFGAYKRTQSTLTQHYVLRPLPLSPIALLPTKYLEKNSWHRCLFRSAGEVLPYLAYEPGVDAGDLEGIDLKDIVLENRVGVMCDGLA
ncbi:hypothetical protein HK097_004881, partial [Rhizophlyctis rosea]